MSPKTLKRLLNQSLALIEIIQNCMSEAGVKSITAEEYGFEFGTEDYLITEIGWPTFNGKMPMTRIWGNGKTEKKEEYFSLHSIDWQKSVAKFVFTTLGNNEEDFEPLFKKTYKHWLNAA